VKFQKKFSSKMPLKQNKQIKEVGRSKSGDENLMMVKQSGCLVAPKQLEYTSKL